MRKVKEDPILEAKLVEAVDKAIHSTQPPEAIIAEKLGQLAGLSSIEDTEKTLAMLYQAWGREIARALREAGYLGQ